MRPSAPTLHVLHDLAMAWVRAAIAGFRQIERDGMDHLIRIRGRTMSSIGHAGSDACLCGQNKRSNRIT